MKVAEFMGYQIQYDARQRRFEAYPKGEGDAVATGATQEEVEAQVKAIVKQTMQLPKQVFIRWEERIRSARLTSVNPAQGEGWIVYDDTRRREKMSWFSRIYEDTENNRKVKSEVDERVRAIARFEAEIKEALQRLDAPISLKGGSQ